MALCSQMWFSSQTATAWGWRSCMRLDRAAAAKASCIRNKRHLYISSHGACLTRDRTPPAHNPRNRAPAFAQRAYTTQINPPYTEPQVSHAIHSRSADNTVATITIHNPRKLNIVSTPIIHQLIETCTSVSTSPTLRAVVLTGGPTAAGKQPSFIGGADINEMNAISSAREAEHFITNIHNACQALRDIPVPVIARINGFALGAGLEIAAACDLRVATKDSIFGMPEVRVGIPSVIEAALLPGLVGMGRTRRLVYLGENIDAVEAERWGLVERVVADEAALDEAVEEWAIDRIIDAGPNAMRSQKRLIQEWENSTLDDGVRAGIAAFGKAYADGGSEPKEYMTERFLKPEKKREKRVKA